MYQLPTKKENSIMKFKIKYTINQNLVMQTSCEPIALEHLNILFKNHLNHEDDVFIM